ncbi:MAG TPA: hypothetical protein VKM54_07690 [Myxococcota bacterium]|nr:hypothetical protein [Myxococcota bacterium]
MREPHLVEAIRDDLGRHCPSLHLYIEKEKAEARGTFPVRGPEGEVADEYLVTIEVPSRYSEDLPVVREVGGRIPWTADRHVNANGEACVLLPDARWESFPVGAPFLEFLAGPLHSFFLGQSIFESTGKWPFGEWSHGRRGILEYYEMLLETESTEVIAGFLWMVSRREVKGHWDCPCGRGKRLRNCCLEKVLDLRKKIPARIASRSFRVLERSSAAPAR